MPANEENVVNNSKLTPNIPDAQKNNSKLMMSPPLSKVRQDSPPDERFEEKKAEIKKRQLETTGSVSSKEQLVTAKE